MQVGGGGGGRAATPRFRSGALATTFTASQGLLLMIPNMYKIAGELTPTVFHVAAERWPRRVSRSLATIRCDGRRAPPASPCWLPFGAGCAGYGADCPCSHLACTLPFLHFFDGFRTSHEVRKIERLDAAVLRAMIDDAWCGPSRSDRSRPIIRHSRYRAESRRLLSGPRNCQPFLSRPVRSMCRRHGSFRALTGRQYHLFDY